MGASNALSITVTFKLYPSDLRRIALMQNWSDAEDIGDRLDSLHTDDLLVLWGGLTAGHKNYDDEPDYDAFTEFCAKIQKIHDETPEMLLLAYAASED